MLVQGPIIPTAALVAGARLLDMGMVANTKQYVGIQFVAVGGFTAGTVNAEIIPDTQYNPCCRQTRGANLGVCRRPLSLRTGRSGVW